MINNVEILVTATDKASAILNKATGGIKGLNQAFTSMTGISLGAAGGIAAVVAVIKSSIDFTMKYADQVKNLSRNIGASTQEASRLIQVSDDVKVSVEQLETGLKAAITRGFSPTIKGLGEMSDAYLAIEDPIARSKYLVDTFGKSGLEMARLMELGSAGIKSMGESAKMILSPADIQKMDKFYNATDELGDTFDNLRVTIALTTAGPLSDFFNTMSRGISTMGQLDLVNTNFMMNLHDIIYQTGGASGATAEWMKKMQEFAAADAMPVDSWAASFRQIPAAVTVAGDAVVNQLDRINNIDINIGDKIAASLKNVAFDEAGGKKIAGFIENVNQALNNGVLTQDQWAKYQQDAYVATQQVKISLGEITAAQAAQNISSTLGVSLQEASRMAHDTKMYLDGIHDVASNVTITRTIITKYQQDAANAYHWGDAFGGSYKIPAAFGKSFKIPAAFGFEGFPTPMGTASGGERVTVTPEGQNQEMDLSEKSIRRMMLMMRDVRLTTL